ncbi:MAG: hypothetical protein B7Z63_04525, partial [Ignavibacteriae bacterium 37-53-5]
MVSLALSRCRVPGQGFQKVLLGRRNYAHELQGEGRTTCRHVRSRLRPVRSRYVSEPIYRATRNLLRLDGRQLFSGEKCRDPARRR